MAYYLAKSEPGTYSIGDLRRDQYTVWDGVTNAQAVRAILTMRPGDKVFIYHSGGVSAVVGLAAVVGKIAALEALNLIPLAGWAVKAPVAGAVIKGLGEAIIFHFERAED